MTESTLTGAALLDPANVPALENAVKEAMGEISRKAKAFPRSLICVA